jgi:hypothetical protein
LNTLSPMPVKGIDRSDVLFGGAVCIGLIVAHAIAYLTHEYAHSFTAWLLGWMHNPLAIDYGHLTLYNVLFLGDVSDNVNYAPILASGHGGFVFVIALAGMVIGNIALYFAMWALSNSRFFMARSVCLAGALSVALMCAGNAWGYVPIRGFTTHADIAIAASGLGLPTWALGLLLLPLSLYVVWHFLCRFIPRHIGSITGLAFARLTIVVVLATYWLFAFFGNEGTSGDYGLVSQLLSIASRYFLFPLSAMYLVVRFRPVTT